MTYEIPTEGRIPILDIVIPIHWENHAMAMFGIWFVLIPLAVMLLRFGKIKPQLYGIPRGTPKFGAGEFCWSAHFYLLYAAILMSLAGAVFAIILSGGFSGTLHAWIGLATVTLGALQIVSSWYRGSHGGRKAAASNPDDRRTWGGDHFDMKPQRWWFEAYHKTAGYFALFCAGGAVATGLSHFWMPVIAAAFALIVFLGLVAAVILQGRGHHHDTYQSVYGYHPDNPFNELRYQQMMDAKGKKP